MKRRKILPVALAVSIFIITWGIILHIVFTASMGYTPLSKEGTTTSTLQDSISTKDLHLFAGNSFKNTTPDMTIGFLLTGLIISKLRVY